MFFVDATFSRAINMIKGNWFVFVLVMAHLNYRIKNKELWYDCLKKVDISHYSQPYGLTQGEKPI